MIDFERRKEKNIFNNGNKREESILTTEQTKILYDINDNQIKKIWKEINLIKCQIFNIVNKNNNESIKEEDSNNIILDEKRHLNGINKTFKDEILDYINKEIKKQLNNNNSNNYSINNKLSSINYNNNNILFEQEKEIQNINEKLLNHESYISSLNLNKLNKNEFNEKIILINHNIEELNKRVFSKTYNIDNNINEDDIIGKKNVFNQYDLNEIKKDINKNFEKVNLKILNELKNQASDIKNLYQEINNFNNTYLKNNIFTFNNDINNETIEEDNFNQDINYKKNDLSNKIYLIKEELRKKVDLEQLNYALKEQEKLNEILTSSSKICKLFWDSDDILINNKYIKWSYQNINTALDIFKWDMNTETIKILQKGVYRIVVGLIGLEKEKNIIIICGKNSFSDIDININMKKYGYIEKENVKYIEKYIAFNENTELKIALVDKNNNINYSEEAFLELKKII